MEASCRNNQDDQAADVRQGRLHLAACQGLACRLSHHTLQGRSAVEAGFIKLADEPGLRADYHSASPRRSTVSLGWYSPLRNAGSLPSAAATARPGAAARLRGCARRAAGDSAKWPRILRI